MLSTASTQHPLDDCRKKKPFLKRTDFSSCGACRSCYHVFLFCSTCNFFSRNFHYAAMQQYRKSNFSDMYCLNCIFVIDATVMAAHKRFFIKLNQIFIIGYSFHYTPCSTEARQRVAGPDLAAYSALATQLRRNVAAMTNRWL